MTTPAVVAIDQGTSSTKVLVVDGTGAVVSQGSAVLRQQVPRPGWVEHEPSEVLASVAAALDSALSRAPHVTPVAVGISNQRESLLLWDRSSGEPVSPMLSWQDRRASDVCQRLASSGHGPLVRSRSGLPLDPMFSAAKATWLLDEYDSTRTRSADLCLGTVDSWLLWHATGQHVVEAGNASRTALVDLVSGDWSDDLLGIFGVPRDVLPRIVDSVGPIGTVRAVPGLRDSRLLGVPVTGVLGDSHAALFAHAGWRPGVTKATYGTGSSIMTRAAPDAPDSTALCRTIAWRLPGEPPTLAWEANILSAGSTLTWLARLLGTTVTALVESAEGDSQDVVLVPAFNGLGAPWWDPKAEAVILGLSLATSEGQMARAALDSVILQVADVVDALARVGSPPSVLLVDGGMVDNRDLMARQSAVTGVDVAVARTPELSALGAAHAAGLGAGVWSQSELEAMPRDYVAVPCAVGLDSARLRSRWAGAVERSRGFRVSPSDPVAPP